MGQWDGIKLKHYPELPGRYGKMTMALIAQVTIHQVKKKLPKPYTDWTADYLAKSIFCGIDGDLKIKDNTIIVALYNVPKSLNFKQHHENLPEKLLEERIEP